MAKYRVKALSFIDNSLRQPGEEIEYGGIPSANLEPLDAAGRAMAAKAPQADRDALVAQNRAAWVDPPTV